MSLNRKLSKNITKVSLQKAKQMSMAFHNIVCGGEGVTFKPFDPTHFFEVIKTYDEVERKLKPKMFDEKGDKHYKFKNESYIKKFLKILFNNVSWEDDGDFDINLSIYNNFEYGDKTVGQGVSEFMSVEGVGRLAKPALAYSGASDEAENLVFDGLNVFTL